MITAILPERSVELFQLYFSSLSRYHILRTIKRTLNPFYFLKIDQNRIFILLAVLRRNVCQVAGPISAA